MKNSSDIIGNRTRDLLACSAVPQPTAPPHVPKLDGSLDFNECEQYNQVVKSDHIVAKEETENVEFNHNQKIIPQHLPTTFTVVATTHNGKSI